MTIDKQTLLDLIGDRPVAYHPMLAKALGGVVEAVFVSQLLYWTDRGKLADGWIFKTQAEMEKETGLTRSNQQTARKKLMELGVLEEARRGVPGVMHFKLDLDRLAQVLTLSNSHNVQTLQCGLQEPDNVDCQDSANYNAETAQCIPETTIDYPKTTTEGDEKKSPVPSSRDPSFLPEAEEQINLLLGHKRPGVSDPSQDQERWFEYQDQAVKLYKDLTGYYPDTKVGKPAILELVSEPGFDLQKWRQSIESCRLAGVKPTNIGCMIDTYNDGGDYGEMQRRKNGGQHAKHDRSKRVQGRISEYSVADPAAFDDQRADDAEP